jgi:rubredoxin
MAEQDGKIAKFDMDPGSFNAALFEAYKGGCDCPVCKILREAVEKIVKRYLPAK